MIKFPDPPEAYSIAVTVDEHLSYDDRRKVYFLCVYHPTRCSQAANHRDTQMLLRLKDGDDDGINHYSFLIGQMIAGVVPPEWPILVVAMPSHQAEVPRRDCPLRRLIRSVPKFFDLSGCLVRQTTVPKAARAWRGQRLDAATHRMSMEARLDDGRTVRGKHLLLLDDVVTTSATMLGASKVLLDAGAASVTRFALTNTQVPKGRRI